MSKGLAFVSLHYSKSRSRRAKVVPAFVRVALGTVVTVIVSYVGVDFSCVRVGSPGVLVVRSFNTTAWVVPALSWFDAVRFRSENFVTYGTDYLYRIA